jgi:hypothetical protein
MSIEPHPNTTLKLRRSEIFGFAEKNTLRSSGASKSFKNH